MSALSLICAIAADALTTEQCVIKGAAVSVPPHAVSSLALELLGDVEEHPPAEEIVLRRADHRADRDGRPLPPIVLTRGGFVSKILRMPSVASRPSLFRLLVTEAA